MRLVRGDLGATAQMRVGCLTPRSCPMTKKRYSVYISEPLARKFDLVASLHPRARSALVEEALRAQLEPAQYPGIGDTMGRMLDDLQNTIANIELHRSIISETLAVFSQYVLTVTPVMPESELES